MTVNMSHYVRLCVRKKLKRYYFSNLMSLMLTLSLQWHCQILCVLSFHISVGWFVEVGCSSCQTVVIMNIWYCQYFIMGRVTLNLCAMQELWSEAMTKDNAMFLSLIFWTTPWILHHYSSSIIMMILISLGSCVLHCYHVMSEKNWERSIALQS